MSKARLSTGIARLDEHLGGGFLPGTLTVVVGASGIGKTQLGVSFAHQGDEQESQRGIVFDMTSRGDSQSHREYAERMFNWTLSDVNPDARPELDKFFEQPRGDYLHVFDQIGRRISRRDLSFEDWQDWKVELAARLQTTIGFMYGNFAAGVRRLVVDGIEPIERASDSIQLELFEYVYHQVLRKEADWVARDLFREHYRANAESAAAHRYDPADVGCVLLYTSHESLLEQLIERPLDEGDLLANANTVIYMGKIREGTKLSRALYISKHRGSYCADEIIPYTIGEAGLQID